MPLSQRARWPSSLRPWPGWQWQQPQQWRACRCYGHGAGVQAASASSAAPAWHEFNEAVAALPTFLAHSKQVKVLSEPREFYETLLERISTAQQRIFVASLYVGKQEDELVQALGSALERNARLSVVVVLDYLRSTREHPKPSSASLIAALAAKYPDRCHLRLYHTPNLSGWRKRLIPRRFDEGWGLQHMKCYGFDDSVIMSGANLSNDYFTNRQDRYIEFKHNAPLADYFAELLDVTSSFSFQVTASDAATKHPRIDIHWPRNNIVSTSFLQKPSIIPDLKARVHDRLEQLTSKWRSKSASARTSMSEPGSDSVPDTILRPTLQMGTFEIRQETDVLVPSFFKLADDLAVAPNGWKTTIDWTSGYFSVQQRYQELVLASKAQVRLVSASPDANGFTGSRGISKYIPPAYTHLQKLFYDQAEARSRQSGRENHISIREWRRPGWTYHAKGIWLSPSYPNPVRDFKSHNLSPFADANDADLYFRHSGRQRPCLSLIGSSNYGRRSASRDLEANVLIQTTSRDLSLELKREVESIREYAVDRVNDRLFAKKDRKVKEGVKVAAKLIEDML
ncbi:CDP-diacylglycerol--glycerol-3-phosphate 3-phosphatidyltransferase [Microbotryomycetes sp. JL201]|nr:CDP-diacylglycerol--glycerol-3-phosphate 3-phosphatidyltransferase [Microbotryomycetes sp. JL201]